MVFEEGRQEKDALELCYPQDLGCNTEMSGPQAFDANYKTACPKRHERQCVPGHESMRR